jgi:Sec-independent protein translocase protein TatA
MPDLLLILIVILVLAVMWRGPKTLPKLGEALGRGVREAKSEASKAQAEIQARATDSTATPSATAPTALTTPTAPTTPTSPTTPSDTSGNRPA